MFDHSLKNYFGKRGALLLLLAALGAAFAGCGGGSGNGNSGGFGTTGTSTGTSSGTSTGSSSGTGTGGVPAGTAAVIGKVVTPAGDPVPGATIIPDTGGLISTTISQGSYRMDGLTGEVVHRLNAAATVNGTNYTGSTEVLPASGSLISNANILLSPQNQQATLTGHVTDLNGNAVYQARVFIAVPNNANYSSLVAFTDSNGVYTLPNVPINLPTVQSMQIAVSLEKYANQSFTITALQAGGTYSQNFTLAPSANQTVNTPTLTAVTAATQPSDVSLGSSLRSRAASSSTGSVYEQIRRRLCPAYARMALGHAASRTRRLAAHLTGGFGTYAIEADVAFDNAAQSGSLFAYTVYRTQGTTAPTQASSEIYDILQDPLANVYTDIDPGYRPYTQYNFALSATNTDRTETPLSLPLSLVPLGPITLTQPAVGETLPNNVTISWTPISGATSYYVFVYGQFPTVNVTPAAASAALSATTTSYTLPAALLTGHDYYAVVVGAEDQTEGTDSTGAVVKITNAVTTFSPITRFHVP